MWAVLSQCLVNNVCLDLYSCVVLIELLAPFHIIACCAMMHDIAGAVVIIQGGDLYNALYDDIPLTWRSGGRDIALQIADGLHQLDTHTRRVSQALSVFPFGCQDLTPIHNFFS